MNRVRLFLFMVTMFGAVETALAKRFNIPPDELVMPCERIIQAEEITRAVIPLTPFRGVNLIFPFKLVDSQTTYVLSSDRSWTFTEAQGTNLVPVTFSSFTNQWGEINDLTIATQGYIFSLTLKADPDLSHHCTNIVFKLSDQQRARIENKEEKEHLHALDQQYQQKFEQLDAEAERKALSLVGALSATAPTKQRIHEERKTTLPNGDEITLYVSIVQQYGRFSNLLFELENDSNSAGLYINAIKLKQGKEGSYHQSIPGYSDFPKKMQASTVRELVYTTIGQLPKTGLLFSVETDRGVVEVSW